MSSVRVLVSTLLATVALALGTVRAEQKSAPPGPMMGMHDGMTDGMMRCMHMGLADVTVENTPTGAVVRLQARDPARVADVQRMAAMMERCMESAPAR